MLPNVNLQFTTDLVTFTEEILNGKLHLLCSDSPTMNQLFSDENDMMKIFTKINSKINSNKFLL